MSSCGFCISNHHDQCLKSYQRWFAEYKGRGKKRKYTITMLDSWRTCDCSDTSHKEE